MNLSNTVGRVLVWARARATVLVAAVLTLALIVTVFVTTFRLYDARRHVAEEAVETDRSFCALANQSRGEINRNREAIRALESSLRQTFELVVPAPDATPAQRERTDAFRKKILSLLDTVKVDGNLALLDCAGIGNGVLDFSLQDAVTDLTTTTRPPG